MQVIANRGFFIAMLVYQGKVLHVRKRQGAGALQHAGFSPGGEYSHGNCRVFIANILPKTHLKIALIKNTKRLLVESSFRLILQTLWFFTTHNKPLSKNRPKRAPKGNDCLVFQPDPSSKVCRDFEFSCRHPVALGVKPPEWGCHLVSKWSSCCCKNPFTTCFGILSVYQTCFVFSNFLSGNWCDFLISFAQENPWNIAARQP